VTHALGNKEGGDCLKSILDDIKKLLGLDTEDTSFDTDIKIHINTSILSLSQMGIGPSNGFIVTSKEDIWDDFLGSNTINLESVKSYIYLKTKLIFDTPSNSTTIDAFNKNISELEFRMILAVETNNLEVT
jgi:hypothetical protein